MNEVPRSERTHIAVFGKCNAGKSTLINTIFGQNLVLTSSIPGTTSDPVYKSIEISDIGASALIDTAGIDDTSDLGEARVAKALSIIEKTDIAILVIRVSSGNVDVSSEKKLIDAFKSKNTPYLIVMNIDNIASNLNIYNNNDNVDVFLVNAKSGDGIDRLLNGLRKIATETIETSITGDLVSEGDLVLLVMPQDIQAPKGRLILPQVQTLRELLDKKCIVLSTTTDKVKEALIKLKSAPKLIITDSQVFKTVYDLKPQESLITSFSVLMAGYKGDITEFIRGANAIDLLTPQSKILIAEACSHKPLDGDIGRIKLPMMLRKHIGDALTIDIVSGADFPKDLSPYDLIIHCGACMFNRKYVLSRINNAKIQNIPITNYGIAIAKMSGILDKITYAS